MSTQVRILKNTAALYTRSILSLVIKLYAARLVLRGLGVEDFGVYQLIGGLVTAFSFLNATMSAATQRYISYEIGLGEKGNVAHVFSVSLNIHLILSVAIFVLIESLGLYFLHWKLDIGTVDASTANWVLLFMSLSLVLTISGVPYNSFIIAKEEMKYFAYVDVAGEVLKLIVALSLSLFASGRLFYYGLLMLAVALTIRIAYVVICHKKFQDCRYKMVWDKGLTKRMSSFTVWTTLSAVSYMVRTQGVAIISNIFFGPILNAAVGIANQVSSAVMTFSKNFQMSFNPQIVKRYAMTEYKMMNQLVTSGAKLSTLLLVAIAVPVILEVDFILRFWLGDVPQYTAAIVILILAETILQCMTCTGNTAIRATERVRNFEIFYNATALLALPAMLIALNLYKMYYVPFMATIIFTAVSSAVKIYFMHKQIPEFDWKSYVWQVVVRTLLVMVIPVVLTSALIHLLEFAPLMRIAVCVISFELLFLLSTYYCGLNSAEKQMVGGILKKIRLKAGSINSVL